MNAAGTDSEFRARSLARGHEAYLFTSPTRYGVDITVWLSAGWVWSATLAHCIAAHSLTDQASAWDALVLDMECGIQPCAQSDCDTCQEETQ